MVNSKDFTKRLEKIMSHYDITATALAEKIDFNRSSISHLISGRNKPSLEFVMKVLKNFDTVSWEWLLYGRGKFPSSEEEVKTAKTSISNKTTPPVTSPNLFSQEIDSDPIAHRDPNQEIERIVIFYRDGTFKPYELP